MSEDELLSPEPASPDRNITAELRLRPERPRVTRISRKVLVAAGAIGAVAVTAAAVYALHANRTPGPVTELVSTEHRSAADGLSTLPRDYTGMPHNVPMLGPPLPGDLGRPIVAAQNGSQALPGQQFGAAPPAPVVNSEVQRRVQEHDAARLSALFAGSAARQQSAQPISPQSNTVPSPSEPSAPSSPQTADADAPQNGQDHKLAFVSAASSKQAVSSDLLHVPTSPYVVQAGTLISGALVTGIRSDLPGEITAQVTENVFDTPTGRYLLIPQGARLIGTYDSQVTAGQSRVLLVWTRLLLPNGRSMELERQPGSDTQGFAGLQDKVDDHFGALLKGALLSTLLSIGTESGSTGQQSDLLQAIRRGASDSVSQTGNQIVRRQLNVQPTLTVRPGYPVRVVVSRDLVLEPYGK